MKRIFPTLTAAILLLATTVLAQQDKGTSPNAVQHLNRAPVNREILQIKLPRPIETGMTVLLLERHCVPTVNVELWVNTGSLDDPKDLPGLAKFTADMLREGTAHRNSSELSSEIDALGATLNADVEFGSSYTQIDASSFAENADKLLDVMSDVVLNPAFPADELGKYQQRQLANLEQQRSDPSFLSYERLFRALYGDSPAAVTSATPASVKAVNPQQLKQFHTEHYVPGKVILGVAGEFDTKQMLALIQRYFGMWKQRPSATSTAAAPAPSPRRIYLVDRPDSVQTNILAAELAVPQGHPDFFAVRVMNRVLGEGTSGRLFMNLREEKGYTYGAYSSFAADNYARPLIANAEVRTTVTDGSLHEMLGELNRLREEAVSNAELDDARRAIVAGFALSLERQDRLLGLWMEVKHNRLPEDYWDRYPAEIAKIGPDSLQQAAKKYLDLQHLQVVCVGSGKEIKDALAKYGPVEVYNVDGKKLTQ